MNSACSKMEPNYLLDSSFRSLYCIWIVSDEENTFASFNGSLTDNIQEGDTVDIIINNFRTIDHPIHMHGHLFHLISYSETENFPYATVEEAAKNNYTNLNFENPPMFDIAYTPAKGHSVIRITANRSGNMVNPLS